MSESALDAWYASTAPRMETLGSKVKALIEDALSGREIPYQRVTYRTKSWDSFSVKARRYKDPRTEVHDLCGVRIVTYLRSDADRAAALVRELFRVDESNSIDKSSELGTDRVGYRAVHFVVRLSSNRSRLIEWRPYSGVKLEIQVRTILQEAWAEFEHDRNYKFTGELPFELQRRLRLAAGLLEIADREFEEIATAVDEYGASVTGAVRKGRKSDLAIALDSVSLREFLATRLKPAVDAGVFEPVFLTTAAADEALDELRGLGLQNVADLDSLVPVDLAERMVKYADHSNVLGVVRTVLMIADANRYFATVWRGAWHGLDRGAAELLRSYGAPIDDLADRYDLDLEAY